MKIVSILKLNFRRGGRVKISQLVKLLGKYDVNKKISFTVDLPNYDEGILIEDVKVSSITDGSGEIFIDLGSEEIEVENE